jgi:hypothetical protein
VPALKPPKAGVDAGHVERPDNIRSMHAISSRRAANAVLTAGARLAALKDQLTDLAASGREAPLTPTQIALHTRLQAEEAEARRQYEEAVHRFRFLSSPSVPSARAAT